MQDLLGVGMVYVKDDIGSLDSKIGKYVRVCGWIRHVRDLGKLVFWRIIDSTGETQVVFKRGEVAEDMLKIAKKAALMSAVIVEGVVRKAKTKGGKEIVPEKVKVMPSEPVLPIDPIGETSELALRLNYRTLDLRNPRRYAIFRIRSTIAQGFREYFYGKGFVEIHTPSISLYVAEGGADVFEVRYFDRRAYLCQSPQLYKQLAVGGLERVFEIVPAFRAEKHWTIRHLCEFTSMDIEVAWIEDIEPLLRYAEEVIVHIFKKLREDAVKEFETLGLEAPEIPDRPFPIMTWNEALMLIKNEGIEVEGKDIPPAGEKFLWRYVREHYGSDFVWIVDWPFDIRPFYAMKYPNTNITKSMDLLYRGLEILTGGQREHRYDILKKQIMEKNLNPSKFGFYLEAFKYGFPPHGGWAIGLDRITMQILNLKNIREAVLFPRDPERIEP